VELGGTDQKFNLLVGRQLQKDVGQNPQVVLMMPLLVGTDGSAKMSKSYDNYIGIDENPNDMYGKSLSIPDELIYTYFELVTDVAINDLPAIEEKAKSDPRNAKHDLAYEITKLYHGEVAAKEARNHFEQTVINKQVPDDAPEFEVAGTKRIMEIIGELKFSPSNGETKRLIKQGGVSIDGEKVTDFGLEVAVGSGEEKVLKVGKRKYAILKGS
jgi:tyrosyl-tRNA synthetase